MKTNHVIAVFVAIFVLWASLFITVLSQSARTNQLLKNDSVLLTQQKETLDSISANAKIRTAQINSLQAHIDCLFNLATQPNHDAYIANAQSCTIASTPVSPHSSGAASAPLQSSKPISSSSPQPAPKTTNKQADNLPKKSNTCKLTLGLLGC